MKRKIALLLASVMALSLVPMNTFAASSNNLSVYTTNVPRYTALLERGWTSGSYVLSNANVYNALKADEQQAVSTAIASFARVEDRAKTVYTKVTAADFASIAGTTIGSTTFTSPSAITDLVNKMNAVALRGSNISSLQTISSGSSDVAYAVDGGNFTLKLDTSVKAGTSFVVELTGAEWFFRQSGVTTGNYANPTAIADYKGWITNRISAASLQNPDVSSNHLNYVDPVDSTRRYGSTALPYVNYDLGLGWYWPNPAATNSGEYGVYYRYGNKTSDGTYSGVPLRPSDSYIGGSYNELAYALVVSPVSISRATVTLLQDGNAGDGIVIPMIVRATADTNDVAVSIRDASVGGVFNTGTWRLTGTSGTATAASSVDTVTHNNTFTFGLNIRESRLGSIATPSTADGRYTTTADDSYTIQLVAPTGFHWDAPSNVKVGVEYGLQWSNSTTGLGMKATSVNYDAMYGNVSSGNAIIATGDYWVEWRRTYTDYQYDDSVLEITVRGLKQSTNVLGTLYIRDLVLFSDSSVTDTGAVKISLKNKDNSNRDLVSEQSDITVGTRNNYGATLTVGTAPELVAGRYEVDQTNGVAYGMLNATDAYHKAASVQWRENVYASWWSGREIIFTLSEGAKFRKVEFTGTNDLLSGHTLRSSSPKFTTTVYTQDKLSSITDAQITLPDSIYVNDNIRHGNVTVSDTTISVINIKPSNSTTARMGFTFVPWISLEVGYGAGDVTITASAAGGYAEMSETKTIAKRIEPIEIVTTVTDLKIGYQYQQTADIEIKETKAGNLLRNKTVYVTINDMISMDMQITNDAVVAVTEGDLKISKATIYGNGYATRQSGSLFGSLGSTSNSGGTVGFVIERVSTKASTIKISNVAVKVDRTVPETNDRPYQVIVWGSAIAENFGNNRDEFQTPGIMKDYVKVVSVANEKTGILTQEVKVSIGETYVLVNGVAQEMDAAAYISPASNSTMVPVRFVANAFGLTNDQIIWDPVNKTVSLLHPSRTIQFTIGSSNMVVNGVSMGMTSPDGLPVYAELKGADGHERTYIPFRALGNAFGVNVDWDATTQTAIYNQTK